MIAGDYKERQRVGKSGKTVTDKIVTASSGAEYVIGPKLGQGGVARVYRSRRVSDGREFAFKEYILSPERAKIHRDIKQNLQTLISKPILDENGSPLRSFIPPLEMVDLPASRGFGYIMELIDTDNCISPPKLFHPGVYPDAQILCRICKNIAHLFWRLHLGSGWCYKDINEGNIYIDPKTGSVTIIDCDNISVPETRTIHGTPGFMAPEVYETSKPDMRTDQYSMAVCFYRVLIGGYPLHGKRTEEYLLRTGRSIKEAAPEIYGQDALFVFDPDDASNSIRSLNAPAYKGRYTLQAKLWDNLPEEIRQCFIRTFSKGLRKRELRTTDKAWYNVFDDIEKNGLVRCSCGKYNFGSQTAGKSCFFCDKKLRQLPSPKGPSRGLPVPFPPKPAPALLGKRTAPPAPAPSVPPPPAQLTTAIIRVKSDAAPTQRVEVTRGVEVPGNLLHPDLPESNLMKLEYNKKKNLLAVVNLSSITWSVTENGQKSPCPPGSRLILKKDTLITVLHRKLQMVVVDVK